jgi:hypothetical protein
VREQQVAAEHPECLEVLDRSPAVLREVVLGIGRRRREVHRHADAALAGEVGGPREQLVAREVVADERHPSGDRSPARQRVEHRTLAIQHLVGRRGEWSELDVPPPRAERGAQSHARHTRSRALWVRDRARLDDGGDAVAHAVDSSQLRGELVVVRRVRTVQRNRPLED